MGLYFYPPSQPSSAGEEGVSANSLLTCGGGVGWRGLVLFMLSVLLSSCVSTSQTQIQKDQAVRLNTELGMRYFSLNQNTLAETKLEKALSLDPNSPEANDAMGYFLWKTGQIDQANFYYQKAYSLAPKDPEVLNARGVYLCETGQSKPGIEAFISAAKTPGFLALGLTYQNAGDCAYLAGDQNSAIEYFEQALKSDPLLPLADLRLAGLYKTQNNLPKAKYYLDRFNHIADPTPESREIAKKLA